MPRLIQKPYYGLFNSEMISALNVPDVLRKRPKGIEKLRRYFGRVHRTGANTTWLTRDSVSCNWPLYLYYTYMIKIGQHQLAYEFKDLINYIARMSHTYFESTGTPSVYRTNREEYEDDFYRKVLKDVSSYSFPLTFTRGPAYMFFTHLHALTGKAPYTKEQIEEDITTWVSKDKPDGQLKDFNKPIVDRVLHELFNKWYHGESEGKLNFREYCDDPLRWGTSGGAKKSSLFGSDYRTKWAWAMSRCLAPDGRLKESYDLYSDALVGDDNISKVALKEEAQKTREIITTTMPSYLRQSYLLYRWGKPNLPSPISTNKWIAEFEVQMPRWYGSIDGDQFDKTVPAWFIREVIDRMGDLDEETRRIADIELKELESLSVEWGNRKWKWEAGVLSGWRFTSIIGTLATHCAAEFIKEKYGLSEAIQHGELGDDLIMWSNTEELTPDQLVEAYNEFGLQANLKKTTSGKIGEFLRKVVSQGGSWGYPALGLRTLIYANPWVGNYSFEQETELSSSWMTFISRLIPHATKQLDVSMMDDCLIDLKNRFGPGDWEDWICTPISAGGGGCIEFNDFNKWTYLEHKEKATKYYSDRFLVVPSLLGIIKSKLVFRKDATFSQIPIRNVMFDAKEIASTAPAYEVHFRHGVNVTKTIYNFLSGNISRSDINAALTSRLPRSIAGSLRRDIVEFLIMGRKALSGYTSICHTKEMASMHTELTNYLTRAIAISKRFCKQKILKPAITVYFMQVYHKFQMPYGTW